MFSIPAQNFSSIDVNHKEISLSKKIDFKTETETLDALISLSQLKSKWHEISLTHIFLYDL